jgi:hypothetical protein
MKMPHNPNELSGGVDWLEQVQVEGEDYGYSELWWAAQGWWEYIATSRWSSATAAIELATVSESEELMVEFRYEVDGVEYTGSKVAMGARSSMWGFYQIITAKRLALRAEQGEGVAIRIDPDEPSRLIALRRISLWMVLCPLIFPVILLFGIFMLIIIITSIYERARGVEVGEC